MTPAEKMGLKPGSRIATTVNITVQKMNNTHLYIPVDTRGTLVEDDGSGRLLCEMDIPTRHALSGSRPEHERYLLLSSIRPLTPEELAEEAATMADVVSPRVSTVERISDDAMWRDAFLAALSGSVALDEKPNDVVASAREIANAAMIEWEAYKGWKSLR